MLSSKSDNLKKIFIGNCQTCISCDYNNSSNILIYEISIESYLSKINELDFDILFTQPIKNDYRDDYRFSTEYLLNHKKKIKIIIFPSLYCRLYNDNIIVKDHNIFDEYFINKFPQEYQTFISKLEEYKIDINFSENNFISNYDIHYLNKAKQIKSNNPDLDINFICCKNFILDNYKKKILFYDLIHPSQITLSFIHTEIYNILNIKNYQNVDYFRCNLNIIYLSNLDDSLAEYIKNIYKNDFKILKLKYFEMEKELNLS